MANPWDEVTNAVRNPGRAIQDITQGAQRTVAAGGDIARQATGSFGYLNPQTAGPMLVQDFTNIEDRKKQAEAEEAQAREQLENSVSAADKVRGNQALYAAQLKKNALRDQGLLSDQVASNERRNMAQKIVQTKNNASSRGLLGSGFQKLGEAGAKAEATANTAQKQNQIRQLSEQQIQDAEDLSSQLGLEMGGVQQNMADQYYRMALQNMQNRSAAYGEILGAGARLGGQYLARRQGQNQDGGGDYYF